MANHTGEITVNIRLKDLERIIRHAVRDEMEKIARKQPNIFYLEPETPLYEDLKAIMRAKKRGKVKIYTRQEAFGG